MTRRLWMAFAAGLVFLGAVPLPRELAAAPAVPAAAPVTGDQIEWKTSWDTTFVANRDRWKKESEALAGEPVRRNAEYAQRLLKLVHALVDRYPQGGEAPEYNYREVAEELAAVTHDSHTTAYLRQLVAEFPGQVRLIAAALDAVLVKVSLDGVRDDPFQADLAEFASTRALALHEAHYVADGLPLLDRARGARFSAFIAQRRFWDASRVVEAATAAGQADVARQLQALLMMYSGRLEDALPLIQELAANPAEYSWANIIHNLQQYQNMDPDFPRDLGLEMKWGALQSRASGADTAAIQAMLDDSASGQGLMPAEGGRRASAWVLLDRVLAAQKPETLAPLRQSQPGPAQEAVDRARKSGDPQAVLLACRRFPWAPAAHEALLALGEEMLRRGAPGLALRMFEDVLGHGPQDDARARAQAGKWLAVAGETQDPEAVKQAFQGIAADAAYPWFGERRPASAIQQQLVDSLKPPAAAPPPALADVALQLIRLPAVAPWAPVEARAISEDVLRASPWPLGSLQVSGDGLLVSGPDLLAWFAGDLSKPVWWRTLNDTVRKSQGRGQGAVAVPGVFHPVVVEGHIYSRWGLDPSGQSPRGLASFDARTGRIEWSTDDDPAWDDRWPINDPAESGGRLYVLTIQDKFGAILPVYLDCLDAATGKLLWERPLGSQNPSLSPMEYHPIPRPLETVRYGNAVTVSRGAVYCSTNLGFVARCDARDGMVEWITPYTRVHMSSNFPAILRRRGSAPIVSGDRVAFLPRDYAGAFALDAQTGKLAWDAPLVPGEDAVVLSDRTLLLSGDAHLASLDLRTGQVLQDRSLKERPTGSPMPMGGAVLVCAGDKLLRVDPGTGAVLEEKPLDKGERPSGCLLRGRSLVGLSAQAASAERLALPPVAAAPIAPPLKVLGQMDRAQPWLWSPPVEAKLPGKTFLVSRGVLECLDTATGVGVWQRFLPPGAGEPIWIEGAMILPGERRLTALDGATGALRWECELPFRLGARRIGPTFIAVARRAGDQPQEQAMAVVDLATGRLVWTRALRQAKRVAKILDIGWDGKDFHCIGDTQDPGEPRGVEFVVRGTDGETLAVRPFPGPEETPPRAIAMGDGFGFCLTTNQALCEFSLADGKAVRREIDLKALNRGPAPAVSVKLVGPWLQIQQRVGVPTDTAALDADGNPPTGKQWILRRGDPAYVLALDYVGETRGDTLYVPTARSVRAIDLPSKKEIVYRLPGAGDLDATRLVLDFGRTKDRFWIACSHPREPADLGPGPLKLDMFDATTGVWLDSQVVPGIFPDIAWHARREPREDESDRPQRTGLQLVCSDTRLLVLDPRGLYLLAPAAGESLARMRELVPAAPQPVTVDGTLDEWDERGAITLKGSDGREGRLQLTHDDDHLYLALRYPSASFVAHVGSGDAAGGDWVEIALATTRGETRAFVLQADSRGRALCEALGGDPMPKAVRAAVRHNPARLEMIYEAGIALKQLFPNTTDFRHMAVSMRVWDEQPGGGGPVRLLAWGEALSGRRIVPDGYRHLLLHPLTPKALETLGAIANEQPELPESREYFTQMAAARGESPEGRLEFFADYIKRHPQNVTVDRLVAFERALRPQYAHDPGKTLLDLATKAGVVPAVCARYALESQAYLSQWVYLDSAKKYPSSIVLEVDDGFVPGSSGWDHRAAWPRPPWADWERRESYVVRMPDRFPAGKWHEIRLPLALLKLSDVPVVGLSYIETGEPRLVWDRAAIVFGGKEEVLLDGALPEGAAVGGAWEWLDKPTRTGKKTHAYAMPPKPTDFHIHYCTDFKPAMAHVAPPEGPYLSQWVYLDPKNLPRSISLGLYADRQWHCHVIWGARSRHGRLMGPLPPAGSWQELRVPMAWTGLTGDPIEGIAFGQDGGQVYWDRTALAANGKETIIIDDDLPRSRWDTLYLWQPWADEFRGTVTPHGYGGKIGAGAAFDSYSGFVEEPHSPALEPDQITVEAWLWQNWPPDGPDQRRWLVAKNGNEETDGHYALMINNQAVGAYLNIGGGKANGVEAFGPQAGLDLRQWHYLAMTYDGRDLKVYLDGKPVAQTPVNKPRTKGTDLLNFGRRPDGRHFYGGVLDEIRIYNRALSAEEIQARFAADGQAPTGEAAKAVAGFWGFDDDATWPTPGAEWQWTHEPPPKSGKLAHTQIARDHWAGHSAFFAKPVLDHLPFDPARATALLRERVPDLGNTEEAWRLFSRMLQINLDPTPQIDLCQWFVRSLPKHPRIVDTLCIMADQYRQLHAGEEGFNPEPFVRALNVDPATFYAYTRRFLNLGTHCNDQWQLVGPFPNPEGKGHDTVYPPETEPFKADAEYDGIDGKVRWKTLTPPAPVVQLAPIFGPKPGPKEQAISPYDPRVQRIAYAACWIYSDKAQKIMIELGRDDSCKVWINRKPVYDGAGNNELLQGQFHVPVDLSAGWNELLLKVGNLYGQWGFVLEPVEIEGHGLPHGIAISSAPQAPNAPPPAEKTP